MYLNNNYNFFRTNGDCSYGKENLLPNCDHSRNKECNSKSKNIYQSDLSNSNSGQSPFINGLLNGQSESNFDINASKPGRKLPKLALVTSGGGFRAMIAYSGVYKVFII